MSTAVTASVAAAIIILILAATGRLRTIAREFPTRQRLSLCLACLWIVVYAAIALPAVMSGSRSEMPVADLAFPSLFTGHLILATFLFIWWRLRRPTTLRRFLRVSGASVDDIPGGIGLGLRVWGVTIVVAVIAGAILQFAFDGLQSHAETAIELPEVPDVMIWMANLPVAKKLLIVLSAMTVEEAFFRAFLQTRIGLIPSSILFAIAHASYGMPTLMLGVFVVSIVIGRDFARHGQLVRSILAHGVFDVIQLLFIVPYAVRQIEQMQATM